MVTVEHVTGQTWPTIGRFKFWLGADTSGQDRTFTYHFGMLAKDRGMFVSFETPSFLTGVKWVVCEEVEALAAAAWKAYEDGQVVLVQRRHQDMWYEYIAIRRD